MAINLYSASRKMRFIYDGKSWSIAKEEEEEVPAELTAEPELRVSTVEQLLMETVDSYHNMVQRYTRMENNSTGPAMAAAYSNLRTK